jgi:hypothetical protein
MSAHPNRQLYRARINTIPARSSGLPASPRFEIPDSFLGAITVLAVWQLIHPKEEVVGKSCQYQLSVVRKTL